jgi:hypothetical protein
MVGQFQGVRKALSTLFTQPCRRVIGFSPPWNLGSPNKHHSLEVPTKLSDASRCLLTHVTVTGSFRSLGISFNAIPTINVASIPNQYIHGGWTIKNYPMTLLWLRGVAGQVGGMPKPCEVWRVPGDGESCARANNGVSPREAVQKVLRVLSGRACARLELKTPHEVLGVV